MVPSTRVLPNVPIPFSRPLLPTVVVPPVCMPLKDTTPPLTVRLPSFSTPPALTVLTPPVVMSAVATRLPLSRNCPACTSTAEVRVLVPFSSSVPSRSNVPLKLLLPLRRSQPIPDLVSLPGPPMSLVQSSQASPSHPFRPPAFWFITTLVSTRSEP